MEALEQVLQEKPGSIRDRLMLGRFAELRGSMGEAGRQVDAVLDMLTDDGDLTTFALSQLLRNVGFGSDSAQNRKRIDRLLEVVSIVERRTSPHSRFAIARARIMLALEDRERFVETTSAAFERWPQNAAIANLDRIGRRWMHMGQGDGSAKVFVIGLSRTGTTSLHQAFASYGLESVHWVNPLTGRLPGDVDLHLFDAFCDINITARFETLSAQFPEARFIWTDRPQESWVRSVSDHYEWQKGVHSPTELRDPRHTGHFEGQSGEIHESLYSQHSSWAAAHGAFAERVEDHFSQLPGSKLLRTSITEGDGWEPLSRFLEKPAPDARFPHANASV